MAEIQVLGEATLTPLRSGAALEALKLAFDTGLRAGDLTAMQTVAGRLETIKGLFELAKLNLEFIQTGNVNGFSEA